MSLCRIDRPRDWLRFRKLFLIRNKNEVAKSILGNLNSEDVSSYPTTTPQSMQTETGKLHKSLVPSIQSLIGLRHYNAFADDESTDLWADDCEFTYSTQHPVFALLLKTGNCHLECCSHANSL